ncbi:TPA: hypothetical protein ACQUHP_006522 [Bacillus cereus]
MGEKDTGFQKAFRFWEKMSQDKEFLRAYEAREKALLDEKAALAHAKAIGIEQGIGQGIEQGIEQGQAKIIRQLHDNGMSVQTIAENLKMTIEEVQRILQLS